VLSEGTDILAIREHIEGRSHASLLTTFINDVIKEAGVELDALDGVAVSKGPGSYTGLRIGVATCKGLCYALNKPLIAVGTLPAMVASRMMDHPTDKRIQVPMIDARRMEVYTAMYTPDLAVVRNVEALVLERDSFSLDDINDQGMVMYGDGMPKAEELYRDITGAEFDHAARPSARGVALIAAQKFDNQVFEDIAYFEPYYLKDFVGTTPRIHIKPPENQ
jgi:tRNA threonylcarbamoyladenosine biosynthesis protein TsaB